jgi:hypothetical protein
MNPYRLNHFYNVARAMNNYVAASAYNYYHPNQYYQSVRDQGNYMAEYQRPSLGDFSLSGLLAYGLQAIGLPANVVNFGYRMGYMVDIFA